MVTILLFPRKKPAQAILIFQCFFNEECMGYGSYCSYYAIVSAFKPTFSEFCIVKFAFFKFKSVRFWNSSLRVCV